MNRCSGSYTVGEDIPAGAYLFTQIEGDRYKPILSFQENFTPPIFDPGNVVPFYFLSCLQTNSSSDIMK